MKINSLPLLARLVVVFFLVSPAKAQWLTQTVVVSNGWTAAYLYVDASSQNLLPATLGQLISPDNPIDKIWLWKAPLSVAQYVTTPASPLNAGGPWVSWGLTNLQNSLATLIPNAAYLIHSTASTNYNWKIQGKPTPPQYGWDMTGLNLIGFDTPATNPPNFQNFFAQDPAIAGIVQIYQYIGGEFSLSPPNPAPVISQYYTPVKRGQAYWVSATNVNNTYFGPFQIQLPNPSGIDYGASGGQITFQLINLSPNPLTISLSLLPSETPPFGQTNIVAVPPLLVEGALNNSNLTYAYTSLVPANSPGGSNVITWTLPPYGQPGSDQPVTLGINRFAMNAGPGALYAGILQFTDSFGFSLVNIPVAATAANNAGLWVGSVSVTNVNYDLKSYATNANGSYVLSAMTNQIVTTNTFTLGVTTNLNINRLVKTNLAINYFAVTNVTINNYTTNGFQIGTFGLVAVTNQYVNYAITTNTVIETDFLGYYFDANFNLVWVTTNINYPPVVATLTNAYLAVVTNQIAAVPTNGTPVAVTNFTFSSYSINSLLVTNALFGDPVTNLVYAANYTITNLSLGTNPARNQFATNLLTGSYRTTNGPLVSIFAITNIGVGSAFATNYFPATRPLLVTTNGNKLVSINVVTNGTSISNVLNSFFTTNSQVINNSFVVNQGITNQIAAVTNLLSTFTYVTGSVTTNYSFSLALLFRTNALYYNVTNYLSSSVSNYVISAYNTSGDSVPAPYPLRLILFDDNNGNCSLLQRVYYGIRQNTNIVVATTEGVLDPAHLDVARRITATHLPWAATNTPWAFSGGTLALGATITSAPIVEQYNDQAANPFLHTYHPDHNNLDNSSPPHELPVGSESYTVSRVITLSFLTNTNDFLSLTTANSTLSGLYRETISLTGFAGYTKSYQTIGRFALKQISPITTLTTQ